MFLDFNGLLKCVPSFSNAVPDFPNAVPGFPYGVPEFPKLVAGGLKK